MFAFHEDAQLQRSRESNLLSQFGVERLEQLNQMWVGVGRPVIGSKQPITPVLSHAFRGLLF
jgi:hypothetical protein